MPNDNELKVGPDHLVWTTWEDDDWNGSTCGQWILSLKGLDVKLYPPKDISAGLLGAIRISIAYYANSVEVVAPPPSP